MKNINRSATLLTATALAVSLVTMAGLPATASVPQGNMAVTALSAGASVEKAALLNAINAYRVSNGRQPVTLNTSLGTVSQNWSILTANQGGFKHNPNFSTQIPSNWTYASEIIGAGEDVEEIMLGWQNSEMHNDILLSDKATEIGLGYAYQGNPAGEYYANNYATAIFASYAKTPTTPVITAVVPKAPIFTSTTYSIPSVNGVVYLVNNVVKNAGTYNGSGTVAITATAASAGFSITGTSKWINTFASTPTPTPTPTPTRPSTEPAPMPVPTVPPIVKSPISLKAESLSGSLGASVSNELYGLPNGGSYQHFQRGSIYWSPATGAKAVTGGIRTVWASQAYERGVLGYPTTDEYQLMSGVAQDYQGGKIMWTPQHGAYILRGGIGSKWQQVNGASMLGLPTSNENGGLPYGGVYQLFQNGVVYWSPATGAYVSKGAIRNTYAQIGYERSRLGYPTSDEYAISTGVAQNYQGGLITWNSKTGAVKITYK